MNERQYCMIGASYGAGGPHGGAAFAPYALNNRSLLERMKKVNSSCEDLGIIEYFERKDQSPREALLDFGTELAKLVEQTIARQNISVVIGGDHSIAHFTVSAAAKALRNSFGEQARLGLIWVDAHGDINTPEITLSGNIHGMPVAHLLGWGDADLSGFGGFSPKISPRDIVYIGLRDPEPEEQRLIVEHNIKAYTMYDIDRYGIGAVCEQARKYLADCQGHYLSFDLDVCDPSLAPAVSTSVRGGVTYREAHFVVEFFAEQEGLLGVEFVEYAPDIDPDGLTAEVVLSLIESAVGKRILPANPGLVTHSVSPES